MLGQEATFINLESFNSSSRHACIVVGKLAHVVERGSPEALQRIMKAVVTIATPVSTGSVGDDGKM